MTLQDLAADNCARQFSTILDEVLPARRRFPRITRSDRQSPRDSHARIQKEDRRMKIMMMKHLSFAFVAAVSLVSIAGCPKKPKPDAGPGIAKLEDIRDQMCKCADKACTDKVTEAYARWGQEQAKAASGDKPAPTADDSKKISAVMED